MKKGTVLIAAAGGNITAIDILNAPLTRQEYEQRGKLLIKDRDLFDIEQAGFLIPSQSHFEMAGGEFCGNASRAAAILLAKAKGVNDVVFTVSGFNQHIYGQVNELSHYLYDVRCEFPMLPIHVEKKTLSNGNVVNIVDLGGIVHVIVEGEFPQDSFDYQRAHYTIILECRLTDRPAVGVIWIKQTSYHVLMHPVIWVKPIDSFFYETSCGSGAIAVSKITGKTVIEQPSGNSIFVQLDNYCVILQSEMEILL